MVYMDKMANRFKGGQAQGGKLVLEGNKLYFKPHGISGMLFRKLEGQFDIKDIKKIYKEDKGISKFIVLEMKDGEEERFVMWGRDKFVGKVNNVIRKLKKK